MPPNVPNIDMLEQGDQQEVCTLACIAEQQQAISAINSLSC